MGKTPLLEPQKSDKTSGHTPPKQTQPPTNTLSSISTKHKPGKLAIIDNRSCLREALAIALREHLEKPIVALDNIHTLLATPEEFNPDISTVILGSGAVEQDLLDEHIQLLRDHLPSAFIVLLTDNYDECTYDIYKRNSLSGVIPSSYRTEQVYLCLCAIESGIKFLPPEPIEKNGTYPQPDSRNVVRKKPDLDGLLTPRQQEVLRYIAEGRSNKYIAAELSLCESTVKVHVSEVMRRLGATSRTHASYLISNFDVETLQKNLE